MNNQTAQVAPEKSIFPVTALIVDDETQAREICTDVVEDAALKARTASTTEEALAVLEETTVDIVITDLKVPQMGGLELLRQSASTLRTCRCSCLRSTAPSKRRLKPRGWARWTM